MSHAPGNANVTPLVTPPEVEEGSRRTSPLAATSTRDELAAALNDLRERGVNNPTEFRSLGVDTIRDTIRWFDAQGGRVTAGVLVIELRSGGKPGWRPAVSAGQSATEYAASVAS